MVRRLTDVLPTKIPPLMLLLSIQQVITASNLGSVCVCVCLPIIYPRVFRPSAFSMLGWYIVKCEGV